MPSLGDSLTALVARACASDVDGADQFAAFPAFYFPVENDALATDGNSAAFQLLHLVNMIPDDAPKFRMAPEFVWQPYRDLLEEKILPAHADPQLGYASRFAGAEAALGDGLASVQGHIWHPVEYLPGDLEAGWTTEEIFADSVSQLAASVSDADREWLAEIRTLPELGSEFVSSIRYERLTVLVLRPWFDRSVFDWRFWTYSGPPFSDGATYPRGRLPAVVSKLILIRNLTMKLTEKALPHVGPSVMYRTIDGSAPARPDILRHLIAVSGDHLKAAAVKEAVLDPAGPVVAQLQHLREAAAAEIADESPAAPAGFRKFHVKFGFDVSGPRAVTAAALASATGNVATVRTALESKRQVIEKMQAKLASMGSGGGPFGFGNLSRKILQATLQNESMSLVTLEPALAAADAECQRWQNAMALLDQLAAIPTDANPYVLAMVCDRLPKAPNPDPELFA